MGDGDRVRFARRMNYSAIWGDSSTEHRAKEYRLVLTRFRDPGNCVSIRLDTIRIALRLRQLRNFLEDLWSIDHRTIRLAIIHGLNDEMVIRSITPTGEGNIERV